MPDMDTAWNSTKAVVEMFTRYADACGAVGRRAFSQALYLAETQFDEGKCFGFSVGYMLEVATFGNSSEFFGTAFKAVGKRISDREDPSLNEFHSNVTGSYHTKQYGKQHRALIEEKAKVQYVSTTAFDQSLWRVKKLAEFVAARETPAYYLIQTPNHAMAAAHRGSYCTFFDPNVGECSFSSPAHLQKMLVKYLGQSVIQKAYAGTKGGRKDGAASKTIHFKVDKYV